MRVFVFVKNRKKQGEEVKVAITWRWVRRCNENWFYFELSDLLQAVSANQMRKRASFEMPL